MAAGPRLIIFGRQGAGKGTQSQLLAERYSIPHISTGDMLRASAASGSDFGRSVKAVMDAGQLVSDDLMEGVVRERLAEPDAQGGFLLDGYPRTPAQAEFLADLLAPEGIDRAINLEVPEEVVVDRITRRRVCVDCQSIYSVGDASADTGRCDNCGGKVVQRDDDTEDAVRRRLAVYAEQTEPLLSWFAERGALRTVDGVGAPAEVAERVVEALDGEL